MKESKLQTGIFELEITLYKSGNFHWKLTNLVTKEIKQGTSKKKRNSSMVI